ncbi:BCCT family transporter [filamentous cyanobacterium LEGE 07170]|nr:BCCT family transporter [filamentous cyanobacterium LEGE 07170]
MENNGNHSNGAPRVKTTRTPGDRNWVKWGFDLHPEVFFVSGALILLFIGITLVYQEQTSATLTAIQGFVSNVMGWFLILSANIYLGTMIILAFSRFGSIRLGGQNARADFPLFAWLAMLFSAGMGIGLMFWSVGEPIFHFLAPPLNGVEAETGAAAQQALGITFFHWGLHAWGIYAAVALALAFFAFNWGLPLTMRSVFYPILGDRIYGWPGNAIDILAVWATLFGLASSLGFGVGQISAGFNFLFDTPDTTAMQVGLIFIITGFATASVVSGLDAGVRRLSELNIYLAASLMIFVILVGPTLFIFGSFAQTLGYYAASLPFLSFWTETFEGTQWQNSWTVFYWAWWISWSPFVGTFIARISRGRTVREFILGVLLLPSIVSFLWMSVFGGSALYLELNGIGNIAEAVNENVATALFVMLQNFPLTGITSFIGIVLVVVFFVTSSDSGSLVVDNLTSGGKLDSPVPQRVFWAIMEGVVAAVLLLSGGLGALQSAAIAVGLPFACVLLVMCYGLYRGLAREMADLEAQKLKAQEASLEEAVPR